MGAKIHPKSENTGKNGIRKLMPKFDAKKTKTCQKKIKSGDLRGFWIDFLAVPGGKGGGRYLKIPD